jgi:molybdopterin converting factor small subunit
LKCVYSFKLKELKESSNEIIFPLNEMINNLTKNNGLRVFVSGENSISNELLQKLDYGRISRLAFWPFFEQECLEDICLDIRSGLLQESQEALEQSIMDFNYASDLKIANRNIVEIAKAAVLGKVKKLLIAEDVKIFGKLNLITGAILLNLVDQDHDIAQTVIAQGGEVSVVPKYKIPFGRAALAILENNRPYVRANLNRSFEMERIVV